MAQLSDVLGSIPGLGGYLAKQQFDQQASTAELANANQFMRLNDSMRQNKQAAITDPLQVQLLQENVRQHQIKNQRDQALEAQTRAIMGGDSSNPSSALSLEQLKKLADMHLAANDPRGVQFQNLYDKRVQAQQEDATLGALRSKEVPVNVSAAPDQAAGLAQFQRMQATLPPGAPISVAVGDAAAPITKTRTGGIFSALMADPNPQIASEAARLQAMVDDPNNKIPSKEIRADAERLAAASRQERGIVTGRENRIEDRKDLIDYAAAANAEKPPKPPTPYQQMQVANQLRDDMRTQLKPVEEIQQKTTEIKKLLATGSPIADLQIQQKLTNLYEESRATNMLFQSNKNFGELSDRMQGFISRTFTGEYTVAQRSQIKQMIDGMEKSVIEPTRTSIHDYYNDIAKESGIPEKFVGRPNFYGSQSKPANSNPQSEAENFLRNLGGKKP